MIPGLTSTQLQFIQTEVVTPLSKMGAQVWVYGSRARGDHSEYSDLDLMVIADNYDDTLRQKVSRIQENLSNSNFPFKVELVLLNDFATSYIQNFEKDKVLISI